MKTLKEMKRDLTRLWKGIPVWVMLIAAVLGIVDAEIGGYMFFQGYVPNNVLEPLVVSVPSSFDLYPGTNNLTISVNNLASTSYSVYFNFTLDNATYQSLYVTFSNDTYTVNPGINSLMAYENITTNAPPFNGTLSVEAFRY